jgi:hypothetical protein
MAMIQNLFSCNVDVLIDFVDILTEFCMHPALSEVGDQVTAIDLAR